MMRIAQIKMPIFVLNTIIILKCGLEKSLARPATRGP